MNQLLLLSGNDIPFTKAKLSVHQPKLKELAFLGEEGFFKSCELINFNKDLLKNEDKIALENKSNFEIFMSIIKGSDVPEMDKVGIQILFTLLFPQYSIYFEDKSILFISLEDENFRTTIDESNFNDFKHIISEIFCLRMNNSGGQEFNPINNKAAEIAEKLKKGRLAAAKSKGMSNRSLNIFNRYISILAVGLSKNVNDLMEYTIYQLYDEFNRFELKESYDVYIRLKMAGAQNLDEVDNWMKDIHN